MSQEITVTNYTGDARDYIKKLITLMDAKFTPSMSVKNTVLVAALYVFSFPYLVLFISFSSSVLCNLSRMVIQH